MTNIILYQISNLKLCIIYLKRSHIINSIVILLKFKFKRRFFLLVRMCVECLAIINCRTGQTVSTYFLAGRHLAAPLHFLAPAILSFFDMLCLSVCLFDLFLQTLIFAESNASFFALSNSPCPYLMTKQFLASFIKCSVRDSGSRISLGRNSDCLDLLFDESSC